MSARAVCSDCGWQSVATTLQRAEQYARDHGCRAERRRCRHCGWRVGQRGLRWLCIRCHADEDVRIDYELPVTHRIDEVLDDLDALGFDPRLPVRPQLRHLAPQLGMTVAAVERAWNRHSTRSVA